MVELRENVKLSGNGFPQSQLDGNLGTLLFDPIFANLIDHLIAQTSEAVERLTDEDDTCPNCGGPGAISSGTWSAELNNCCKPCNGSGKVRL